MLRNVKETYTYLDVIIFLIHYVAFTTVLELFARKISFFIRRQKKMTIGCVIQIKCATFVVDYSS